MKGIHTGKCKHCNEDVGMSLILCDSCCHKVLDILPADPKERIEIYQIVIDESNNPIATWAAHQLMEDARDEIERRILNISDVLESRDI
jgi:hypothetical protein